MVDSSSILDGMMLIAVLDAPSSSAAAHVKYTAIRRHCNRPTGRPTVRISNSISKHEDGFLGVDIHTSQLRALVGWSS